VAIDSGKDVNKRGAHNTSCLIVAVDGEHEEVVELLLQRSEIEVNARSDKQQTALHFACYINNPTIVSKLLEHTGLDCNLRDDEGNSPLMFAMMVPSRNVEIVRQLVADERVDLDIRDSDGRTLEEIAKDNKYSNSDIRWCALGEGPLENILQAISYGRILREVVSLRRKETFVAQIAKLQGVPDSSDITVECQGKEFPCHRSILGARSPTFAEGLASGWKEAIGRKWEVKEADPAAVKDMLTFIYSSNIPEEGIKERAGELLNLARLYHLPELAVACRKALLKGLTAGNAVRTLIQLDQADGRDASEMKVDKDEVINYIKKNVKEIVKDEQWKTFVKTYPDLVTDMLVALSNQ